MATKPDDWMPLKIGAYLRDTTHLTRDQHGAYFLLLMAYWSRQGPLPADDRQLAAIVKATPAEWRRLKIIIAPFFQEREGRWFQKRADQELAVAQKHMTARSEAGRIGAAKRWQTHSEGIRKDDSKPDGKPMQSRCQNDAPITKNLLPDKDSSSLRSEGAERAADRLDEDPKAILFSEGHRWLVEVTGKSQAEARSIIGRMLRDMGGDAHASALLGIFRDTKRDQKSSPLDWILKIVSSQTKARAGPAADQAKLGIDKVTGKEWARTA